VSDVSTKAADVKLVIFDVDGVLTNGGLFFGDSGEEYKMFNSKDGHGMKMLQDSGVHIAIITGRSSNVVTQRMINLGVEHVFQGVVDKNIAYQELKAQLGINDRNIAYMGDDVIDLPVMTKVGLSMAVADAHSVVIENADWTSQYKGGHGAAREACEMIMQAQGNLAPMIKGYLS
jgi:3-deoxy-D-manno-octulosonate 8-phosphate phosphatase (KDO 8-P phosphatase)